jgi:hypothetical protein
MDGGQIFSLRLIYGGRYCGQEEKGCQEVSQEEGKEEEEVVLPRSARGTYVAGFCCLCSRSLCKVTSSAPLYDPTRKSRGDRLTGLRGSSVFVILLGGGLSIAHFDQTIAAVRFTPPDERLVPPLICGPFRAIP